jgi:uncharacterized protein (TIGR00369 family)
MTKANTELVHEIFANAPFLKTVGIEFVGCGPGTCDTRLTVSADIRQQHGFVHAGAVMTLADHTCGGAAATTVSDTQDVITIETRVAFLRPATGSQLTCHASVLRSGRTIIFVEAEVAGLRDGARVLVAKASSTLAIIGRARSESPA